MAWPLPAELRSPFSLQLLAPSRHRMAHTSWKVPWSTPQGSADGVPCSPGAPSSYLLGFTFLLRGVYLGLEKLD